MNYAVAITFLFVLAWWIVGKVIQAARDVHSEADRIREEAQKMKAPEAMKSKPPITRPAQAERVCK